MAELYNFLGLTVGLNLNSKTTEEKREAYAQDITYSTNNELGFDYLRDNMVNYSEDSNASITLQSLMRLTQF